jgi:hypothetical protein
MAAFRENRWQIKGAVDERLMKGFLRSLFSKSLLRLPSPGADGPRLTETKSRCSYLRVVRLAGGDTILR